MSNECSKDVSDSVQMGADTNSPSVKITAGASRELDDKDKDNDDESNNKSK